MKVIRLKGVHSDWRIAEKGGLAQVIKICENFHGQSRESEATKFMGL